MKKKLFSTFVAMFLIFGLIQATVLPYLPQEATLTDGTSVNLNEFLLPTSGNYSLEVITDGNEISIEGGVYTYQPTATGTIRFVYYNNVMYVYENNAYVGTLTANTISAGGNLIQNGGFEADAAANPNPISGGWKAYDSNKALSIGNQSGASIRNSNYYAGSYAMLLRQPFNYMTQAINNVEANTRYKISYYWRVNDTGQAGAVYQIDLGTTEFGTEVISVPAHTVTATTTYTKFETIVSIGNVVPTWFCFNRITGAGENRYDWYDEFSMVKVNAGISGATAATILEGAAYAPVFSLADGDCYDMTSFIINPSFENSAMSNNAPYGWSQSVGASSSRSGTGFGDGSIVGTTNWQIWQATQSGETYQEIVSLPDGKYTLKAGIGGVLANNSGVTSAVLFANNGISANVVYDGNGAWYEANGVVTDGTLKIGVAIEYTSGGINTKMDNFTLYYYGPVDLSDLEDQLQGLITIANEITANMNTGVASALSTAISTAETLLQDENRTEDDLNDAIDVLTTAIANANANINALDELNTALTGANNLLSENMYSGVLSALQTQINTADGLTDPIGTTDELASALSSLQTVVNTANSSIINYNYLSTLIATAENKPAKADEGKTELDVIVAPVKTALEAKTLDDAAMTSAELKALIEAVNTYLFAGTTNQTSKITNPSFEAGTSHPATGWTFNAVTSGYADFKINASASHAGNNHYNIWAANVTSINVSQNLELPAGTYALSAAFRVGAVSNQHIYATIGENTVNSLPINKIYGDSEWQTVSLNFTLPEAATVTIGAASTGSGSGTAGWMRLDDFQLASLVLDDYTLSDLKVAGTTIAGFSATTYNYTYYVAPGTTIVPEVSGTATSGTISSLTQAAAIPGTATITVTAESGTTKDYTVDFVVDYMAGWDYNLNAGTPADAGWTTSDDAVVLGTGTEIYRDNMYGYARVLQQYKPEVTFYYPVQLEEGKIYKLTASWCWVWEGSSPTSTFGMYDDERSLLKSIESTSTADSGKDRKTVELSFVASSTGTYYFGWTSNTGRNIIWGLSLIETGDAIEIAFDARNEGEGVAIEPQYLMDGDKIVMPAIPTYNGWVFEGWYTDNGTFQNAWDFENATVDQSITLYAKWSNDISVGLEDNNVEKMNIVSLQGGIKIQSNTVQNINIYALTGQLVKQAIVQEGTTFVELPIGMYIVNNKKVVVR